MTTETKRDLVADLALCEAATAGPWRAELGVRERGDRRPAVLTHYDDDWKDEFIHADFANMNDAEFCAEAHEGWPHSIRRAIASEKAVDELAHDNGRLRESLTDVLAAIDRGDLIRAKMSSGMDYVISCAREALHNE